MKDQPNFFHKLGDAVKAFRSEFSNAGVRGSRWNYIPTMDQLTTAWSNAWSRRSNINFAQEIGDLTQSSLVMAAVNWVGRAIPEAIPRVVEDKADGEEAPVFQHPAVKLLRRPNPHYAGATLAKAMALSWIFNGNIYLVKHRNILDQVIRLYWVPHWAMRPVRETSDAFVSYYEMNVDGRWFRLPGVKRRGKEDPLANVIHFRDGIDPHNDMLGLSPLGSLLREIFTDNEAAYYAAVIMKNMGVIPYVVSPRNDDADVDAAAIKEELIHQTTGDNAAKPVVLTGAVEFNKVGATPAEMALDSLRNVPEERLAGVIGLPGMVLGFGGAWARSTFSNYAQAVESAYEGYMVPLWKYLEEEWTHQFLLPDFADGDSPLRVEYDLSKVRALQEDEDALHRRIGQDYQNGIVTRAEARGTLGRKVDPARDNVFLVRSGTSTISADAPQTQQPPSATLPPTPDTAPPEPEPEVEQVKRALPMEYALKLAGPHSFSTTHVLLPQHFAQPLLTFGATLPDSELHEKGRETEPHVTIKYGLHTNDAEDVKAVLADMPPIRLTFGETGIFTRDDFDVLFVTVSSPDLARLHRRLSRRLENTATHAGYTPHATIAYLQPGEGQKYVGKSILHAGASPLTLTVNTIIFSNTKGEQTPIALTGLSTKSVKATNEDGADEDEEARAWFDAGAPDDLQGLLEAEEVD